LSLDANPLVENYRRVTAADLGNGDKSLILREEMLFNEIMNGSITLKVSLARSNSKRCGVVRL